MRDDLIAAGGIELSLSYIKRKSIYRIWVAAKRNKDAGAIIDILEVLVTSPFKTNLRESFYDTAQFYGRFEPKGKLNFDFLCWLQRALYDCEYFTEFELTALYENATALYVATRANISKSTRSARLTLPVESVLSTISARLPSITLKL